MYIYIYIFIYVYIYIYIHMSICIYVYMYITQAGKTISLLELSVLGKFEVLGVLNGGSELPQKLIAEFCRCDLSCLNST